MLKIYYTEFLRIFNANKTNIYYILIFSSYRGHENENEIFLIENKLQQELIFYNPGQN